MQFQKHKIFKKGNHFPFYIENHRQAPSCPAVYFITVIDGLFEHVYYVGSSSWVRGRLAWHPIISKLKKQGMSTKMYIIPSSERDYKSLEQAMIKEFQPVSNVIGK